MLLKGVRYMVGSLEEQYMYLRKTIVFWKFI